MNDCLIKAEERTEKINKIRKSGYTPGVIYGEGIEGTVHIKFNALDLQKALANCTVNSRVQVQFRDEERLCVLREIQFHPVTKSILHIDVLVLNKNNQVKLKVPVIFNGKHALEEKHLFLQVLINELEVQGMITSLPDYIHIDVSSRNAGEKILAKEVQLGSDIKLIDDVNEVMAVVSVIREKEADKDQDKDLEVAG